APGVIVLAAALLALAALSFGWRDRSHRWLASGMLAAFVVLNGPLARLGDVRPSTNKFLAGLQTNPNIQTLLTRWNPVYRVDVMGGKPGTPIRFGRSAAWGVSDRFVGDGPEHYVITHDGDASTMLYRFDGDF